MYRILSFAAALVGLGLAFVIQRLFGQVRRRALLPAVVFGWAVALMLVVTIIILIEAYQFYAADYSLTRQYWPRFAAGIGAFLIVGGFIAKLHCDRMRISWRDAYGEMMAEASIDAAIVWLAWTTVHSAYDGGSAAVVRMLRTPAQVDSLSLVFAASIGIGWLMLEGVVPFLLVPRLPQPVAAEEPVSE